MEADVLIVGAGPAGISAALTAEKFGAKVILIDESFSPGGQLRQQTQYFSNLPTGYEPDIGLKVIETLIKHLYASSVQVYTNHTMIGAYKNGMIGVTDGNKTFPILARANILAPGAQEEAKIFPGWTLPGVMTAGAAQILINRESVLPGKRAVMIGTNNFAFTVAKQLHDCGVTIEAFIEEKSQITCSDGILRDELKHVPVWTESTVQIAQGTGQVERVSVHTPEGRKEIDVDLICISNGFTPILEPFVIMDCELTYKKHLGGWVPLYNEKLQTTNPSCFIAGNAAGITDLGPILLTGEIAAISALEEIGILNSEEAEIERRKRWLELEKLENTAVCQARKNLIASSRSRQSPLTKSK